MQGMKRLKMLILTLVLSGGAVAAQALTLVEQYALTGGHGWAVAVRDYHIILIDVFYLSTKRSIRPQHA